jgi:hypothetical protein
MNRAPTSAETGAVAKRRSRDLVPHLAPEQLADPLALVELVDHAVEAGLKQPDLAAVIDPNLGVEVAVGDAVERGAHGADRI